MSGWGLRLDGGPNPNAPDDVYEEMRREFSDVELIALSIAIGAINLWNRMVIGFRNEHPKDRSRAA